MIEFINVSFSYPQNGLEGIRAIERLDLRIAEGEFVALVGRNGSGKSTVGRLATALLLPDYGKTLIAGLDTRAARNHAAIRRQVGILFQRPQDQIVATTVAEDIAFGPGNLGLAPQEIRLRVEDALAATGLSGYGQRPSHLLSAGETQRVALAGVLAMQPRCIIFDETTAMLDPDGREMVMRQVKRLHQQGITILFITHLMEEAAQAERVIALQAGRLALDGTPAQVFSARASLEAIGLDLPAVTRMGNALHSVWPRVPEGILIMEDLLRCLPARLSNASPKKEKVLEAAQTAKVIEVEGLAHTYLRGTPFAHQSLRDVNLVVRKGHLHALAGATGSGKSTLLQHLNALIRPQAGKVAALGHDLSDENLDVKNLRRLVGLTFQQPEDQFFEQYVGDEVAVAARNFKIDGRLSDIVRDALQAVGLDFDATKDRFTSTLSGGEQRKVALAATLAGQPEVLLLDEPLAGLDPQSRREVAWTLKNENRRGTTLVISTHQLEELVEWMDALSVLADGQDIRHGEPGAVFSAMQKTPVSGFHFPLAVQIANTLRARGWPVPPDAVSIEEIIQALLALTDGEPDE